MEPLILMVMVFIVTTVVQRVNTEWLIIVCRMTGIIIIKLGIVTYVNMSDYCQHGHLISCGHRVTLLPLSRGLFLVPALNINITLTLHKTLT
jgi:hypothetical protein